MASRRSLRIAGFAPIASPDAQVLILGSMPGEASLRAGEYYAHPRNAFWKLMGELLDIPATANYAARATALLDARIALWDVLRSCRRQGSLDSGIEPATIRVNDFGTFFARHPDIRLVCFNGTAAERWYRSQVLRSTDSGHAVRQHVRLPSTSPAHAGLSYVAKVLAWRDALTPSLPLRPPRRHERPQQAR